MGTAAPYIGALSCAAALSGALAAITAEAAGEPAWQRLTSVRTWGYQLQHAHPAALAKAGCDLLVIDYATDKQPLRREDLNRIRRSRNPPPIILAYLSIGEAENYRFYWRKTWRPGSPAWLGQENPQWENNFAVRFWMPAWQSIFLRPGSGYIARIAKAGFDGIYLDRVDVFSDWEHERPAARQDMIDFVRAIAAYSRRLSPGFIVVPQNGEELLTNAGFRAAIDAVAKEDLFFGASQDGARNPEEEVFTSLGYLSHATSAGLPVFVVEYVSDPQDQRAVLNEADRLGFVPLLAKRALATAPSCQR